MVTVGNRSKMRGLLLIVAVLLPFVEGVRDQEMAIQFGMVDPGQTVPKCDSQVLTVQSASDSCIFLNSSWGMWESAGVALPGDVLFKVQCAGDSVNYKFYLDCTKGSLSAVCPFIGQDACGIKAIDASTFMTTPGSTKVGECNKQCISIPDNIQGMSTGALAGDHCMNINVKECA
eukprot:Hpha_TRINITY_DN25405_c0_g1::TRINITY_DN25405_c0_g1_i1::g.167737::m.167737